MFARFSYVKVHYMYKVNLGYYKHIYNVLLTKLLPEDSQKIIRQTGKTCVCVCDTVCVSEINHTHSWNTGTTDERPVTLTFCSVTCQSFTPLISELHSSLLCCLAATID